MFTQKPMPRHLWCTVYKNQSLGRTSVFQLWYVHSTECCSVNKRTDMFVHATEWMNVKCRVLSKRSQSHDFKIMTFWKRQIMGINQISKS